MLNNLTTDGRNCAIDGQGKGAGGERLNVFLFTTFFFAHCALTHCRGTLLNQIGKGGWGATTFFSYFF